MTHTNMSYDEAFYWLDQEIEQREKDLVSFSSVVNEYFLNNDDPTPADLYKLGCFLENGGGSTDTVGISLVCLAARQGHSEAIQRYEDLTGDKIILSE